MNKQFRRLNNLICAASLAIFTPFFSSAQANNLQIINTVQQYKYLVKNNSDQEMVLLKIKNNLIIDLRYATSENFTKSKLYPKSKVTFLRKPVAHALYAVLNDLQNHGYGIKVWDAYRPYSTTVKMWKMIKDDRYVANPAKGSGHNKGIAIDLTLIDLKTGKELDMGTGFDNFTDTAHHEFTGITKVQQQNRTLLKSIMEQHGFKALLTEWWHYAWTDAEKFPVMNLSFRQLERLAD